MDLFISYRRNGGIDIARNFWKELREQDYYSFFDIDSIRDGEFPEVIYQNIERSNNFLIILTPNALDRCESETDWVRREIRAAIEQGKNIIPIVCKGFKFDDSLPADIEKIRVVQPINYDGLNFNEAVKKIIIRLQDENGEALRLSKNRNISNTFYSEGHMSDEERKRIKADQEALRPIEGTIFDRLFEGRKDVVVFNPAIYEIESYMERYNRDEVSNVYGLMSSKEDAEDANQRFATFGKQENHFYVGNMEHENFEDEMDRILSDYNLSSFDFADLTLILRDLVEPEEKLRSVIERMSPGGVVYVRELDHGMALAYPDENGLFKKMLEYIRSDIYSGDYEAGRKVYNWMRNADLENIHFEAKQLSTVGLKKKEKRVLFEALFSYVEREYVVMYEKEPTKDWKEALEWLQENYSRMEREFCNDDFFFSTGFMEFYGFVEE